jgi:hypothetical protein
VVARTTNKHCIALISAELQDFVALDRRDVRQIHTVPGIHQAIHQVGTSCRSIPGPPREFVPVRSQFREDYAELIGQAPLQCNPVLGIARAASQTTTTPLFECRSIPLNFISAYVK